MRGVLYVKERKETAEGGNVVARLHVRSPPKANETGGGQKRNRQAERQMSLLPVAKWTAALSSRHRPPESLLAWLAAGHKSLRINTRVHTGTV